MRNKVLIADDNRAITEVLKLNFDLLGYEVQVAGDGEEAEAKCRSFKPDVMILDVMMPKKNGYKVCRDLKNDSETASTPIILLTAKNLKEDVYWGYDSGADAYITKPYDPRQLEILVDQLIQERQTGLRTTAWTGLAASSRVEAEHAARLDAGAPSVLIEVALDPAGVQGFASKYGRPRLKDLIHRLGWQLYETVRDSSTAGVVGQSPDDHFVITLPPKEVEGVRDRVLSRLEETVLASYEASDVKRGAGGTGGNPEGEARKAPLISVLWRDITDRQP